MEKIVLNDDESMLLLLTKNHQHKDVPLGNISSGSIEYIQACNNFRVWGTLNNKRNAPLFNPYLDLCIKLLNSHQFANILTEIYKHGNGWYRNDEDICKYMISQLAQRLVTDLILDESLIDSSGR